jgi:hypothetical protein
LETLVEVPIEGARNDFTQQEQTKAKENEGLKITIQAKGHPMLL